MLFFGVFLQQNPMLKRPRRRDLQPRAVGCLQPRSSTELNCSWAAPQGMAGEDGDTPWRFPARHGGTQKWMVYFMEYPIKMDDLGVPLF